MIGISSSGRSFRAIAHYLAAGRSGEEHDRVAWTAARNLPTDDPELAGKIMRATAAANARVRLPVYHLALSFDPNDAVDRAAMERVADRVLARLALTEHQALLVAHRDREHAHVHLLVNRVHPETGKAWDRWQDQRVVQEVLRAEERALGLREVPGTLAQRPPPTMETEHTETAPPPATSAAVFGAREDGRAPARAAEPHTVTTPASAGPDPDRVTALARAQFTAARAADAARARARQLDAAAARVEATGRELARAVSAVYADADRARRAFVAHAGRRGAAEAERMLRERPETFGALRTEPTTAEERRAFGWRRRAAGAPRAGPAAEMVAAAATAGRAHLEAREAFRTSAAESRARRLESAFDRALADLYAEPAVARAAFIRLAGEHGVEHAAGVLSGEPATLGAPRVVHAGDETVDPETLAEWRRTAVTAGRALMAAREKAERGSLPRGRAAERLAAEPGFARREAELWTARERAARRSLQAALAAPSAAVEPQLAPDGRAGAAHLATRIADAGSGPAATPGRLLASHVRRAVVDAMLDRGEHEA